jgi:hypothetical protein
MRPARSVPATLPITVTTTAPARIHPTSRIAETSIERPKTKKKSAAKTSRQLKKRSSTSSRTEVSESTTPASRAPIASESPSSCAIALIPTTKPTTASRKNSRGSQSRKRSIGRDSHFEAARATATNPIALATISSVVSRAPPPPPANPRTRASTRSSATRIASTRSVSSSASRRKSIRPLTVIALEET